jgi:hypothetical protein
MSINVNVHFDGASINETLAIRVGEHKEAIKRSLLHAQRVAEKFIAADSETGLLEFQATLLRVVSDAVALEGVRDMVTLLSDSLRASVEQ